MPLRVVGKGKHAIPEAMSIPYQFSPKYRRRHDWYTRYDTSKEQNMTLNDLRAQHCAPLKGQQHQVSGASARELLALLDGWEFGPDQVELRKLFRFPDFAHALAFVNALGFVAERENHHPDLELGWGRCLVRFSTHDVGGLSLNDFICAAKTDALLA
jgi:4a-hydroxytetrahydrobiopterin dehydratase